MARISPGKGDIQTQRLFHIDWYSEAWTSSADTIHKVLDLVAHILTRPLQGTSDKGILKEKFSLCTDQNLRGGGPLPLVRIRIPKALHFFLGRVQAAVKLGRFYHVWSRNNF